MTIQDRAHCFFSGWGCKGELSLWRYFLSEPNSIAKFLASLWSLFHFLPIFCYKSWLQVARFDMTILALIWRWWSLLSQSLSFEDFRFLFSLLLWFSFHFYKSMLRKQPEIQLIPSCISKLGSFIVWSCHATVFILLVFHNIENIFHLLITPFPHIVKTLKRCGVGYWVFVRISTYSFWRWHVLRINIFEFVTWDSNRLIASFN